MRRRIGCWSPSVLLGTLLVMVALPAAAYVCPGGSTDYAISCISLPNGVPCINTAVGAGCCAPGVCQSQVCNLPTSQTACNDSNICTTDTCTTAGGGNNNAICTFTPLADGSSCNADGNLCTLDTCQGGSCVVGPQKDCSGKTGCDAQCQTIGCNPSSGGCICVNANEGQHCNDGKDCTYAEVCNNGACGTQAGNGLLRPAGTPCWDGDWCHPGTCNGTDKGCKNRVTLAAGSPCDPNNCTNAVCDSHANCIVVSCTGPSANCDQCGPNAPCKTSTQNPDFPCGCVDAPIYNPPN